MSAPGPAPDLETLYDFETQLETAARALLAAAGFALIDPEVATDPETGEPVAVPDRGVTPEFDIGAATGDRCFTGVDDESEYSVYEGMFSVLGTVPFSPPLRAGRPEFIRDLRRDRAKIRALFMESRNPFVAANLPYLDVLSIMPARPERRPDAARGVNEYQLFWRFRFAIRPTAWPVPDA